MATTKITDLTAYTDPINTDVLPIVDITSDVTKKVSIANVMKNASLGSAAAPGISFDGDPNTGIYSPGANQVAISTDGTARLTAGTTAITAAIPVDVLLGSASTPSYTFTGDLNTGIYSPGADQVAISTNGTGRLFVDASGRVGIGVATPSDTFHVAGGARIGANDTSTAALEIGTGATGDRIALIDLTGDTTYSDFGLRLIRQSGANGNSELRHRGTGSLIFQSFDAGNITFQTSANERLRITSDGKVGVGTSSPVTQTHIVNNGGVGTPIDVFRVQSEGAYFNVKLSPAASPTDALTTLTAYSGGGGNSSNSAFAFSTRTSGTESEKVRIDSSGRLGVGTTSPGEKLEIQDGSISVGSSTNTSSTNVLLSGYGYIIGATKYGKTSIRSTYSNATNSASLEFYVSSGGTATAEAVRIDSSGRVGIGTSSPGGNLHVQGSTGDAARFYLTDGDATGTGNSFLITKSGTITTLSDRQAGSTLVFGTADTERLRINSSGNVGIGTQSPTESLEVVGNAILDTSNATLKIKQGVTGTTGAIDFTLNTDSTSYGSLNLVYDDRITQGLRLNTVYPLTLECGAAEEIRFTRSTTESARIDSSGRLLVGTSSSPSAGEGQYARIVAQGYTGGATGGGYISLQRGEAATAITAEEELGLINFGDSAGNTFGTIACRADATAGAGDYPGRLVFSTTADGASSPTERMRITNAGAVVIGTTTAYGADGTTIAQGEVFSRKASNQSLTLRRDTTDGTIAEFRRDATAVGTISVTTTATAYNTSSDYRLKENVAPVTDGITRLQQLKPSRFNFIADPDKTVDGFIAHEVQTIVPEAITGEKDAVDDEGNPEYQGIDQSKLVPLLTAALQEAIAKIESLEARLTALESA